MSNHANIVMSVAVSFLLDSGNILIEKHGKELFCPENLLSSVTGSNV